MSINLVVSITILLLSPLSVASNTLIISVWLRFKRLRTPSNTLILSLCVADLSFGLFLPAIIALDLILPQSPSTDFETKLTTCHVVFTVLLTCSSASLLSIALIAIDRFTSVSQPLRYNHFVTMSNVHKFIAVSWTYAFSIGVILPCVILRQTSDLLLWRYEYILVWTALLVYCPCLVCVMVSYGYIYVIARSHARAIYSVEVSLHNGSTCEVTNATTLGHTNRYGLTLALILSSMVISWMPLLTVSFYDLFVFYNTHNATKSLPERESNWLELTKLSNETQVSQSVREGYAGHHETSRSISDSRLLLFLPLALTSLLHPWLYGYRSAEIRSAATRLLDWMVTKITGRSSSIEIMYSYHKGEMTSCASNLRLLGASPTQTTGPCCSPSPNAERKHSNLSIHLMICDNHVTSL